MMAESSSISNEERASSDAETASDPAALPTVYHVTHWKAGSQWIRAILESACCDRIVSLKPDMSHVTEDLQVSGGIYTPVYLDYKEFIASVDQGQAYRVFFVMRDIRDTLISWYFSLKVSHGASKTNRVDEFREVLNELSFDDGLEYLMGPPLARVLRMQQSWLESGERVFRYEDLIADQHFVFRQIHDHCQLAVLNEKWRNVVESNSFEKVSGRKRGDEDITKHHRKGTSGDWENHFSPKIKALFKGKFGQILIETGYERSTDW